MSLERTSFFLWMHIMAERVQNRLFRRNLPFLAGLTVVQIFCSVFFLVGFVGNTFGPSSEILQTGEAGWLQYVAGLGLVIGSVASIRMMFLALKANLESEEMVKLTRGEFEAAVAARLDHWGLSKAEREVAWFTIKGLDIKDIAAMRGSASGTIKVQLASIYRKSGVENRAQFVSLLIDDLLVDLPLEQINAKD